MKKATNDLCVLGGMFFVVGYLYDSLGNLVQFLGESLSDEWQKSQQAMWSNISSLLFPVFIILFCLLYFKKKNFAFLQKFIKNFPKISVYLHYIGYAGYILLAVDAVLFSFAYFVVMNEVVQEYLIDVIAIINIIGAIMALLLANRDVFGKNEADKLQ